MHGFHTTLAALAAGKAWPGPPSQHFAHLTTGQAVIAAIAITAVLFCIVQGLRALVRGDRYSDRY